MEAEVLILFREYQEYAVFLSVLINIIIAILGVIPSFFITGANILFFGFWNGILVSILGEAIGALVAFTLYRKGFKKLIKNRLEKYPKLIRLTELEGKKAFFSVLSLRLMPFMPSGLVTFAASIGKMSTINFTFASSLGKLPALLFEGFSVYQIAQSSLKGKLFLLILGLIILWFNFRSKTK